MSEAKDLVAIKVLTPEIVFAPGGVDEILGKIENEVRSFKGDISTLGGRNAIASMAYKVARSKTALDDMGKQLVSDWKAKASAVDAERRTIRERLDTLKDEVRKPLTDWENADRLRVLAHQAALAEIENATAGWQTRPSADDIAQRIVWLSELPARDWQEFSSRAAEALSVMLRTLKERHAEAVTYEAEQVELARLRAENVVREQKERDERIAAEAAERARVAAENKAKAERERIERDAAEKVESANAAAERAELLRKQEAERAVIRQRQAIEEERARVAQEKAAETAATAKREADKRHKGRINSAAVADLVKAGLTEEQAKSVVIAIASGKVANVRISY